MAEEDGPEIDAEEVEQVDITAVAREKLKEGEVILGDGDNKQKAESRGLCNKPLLLQKLRDIEYKVPEGAKRVPWIDTLTIDGLTSLPKGTSPKDGVKLESTFLGMAGEAVKEAYRRLRVMKVPCSRPSDFYADMMRSDKTMYQVRRRAAEETRRIKIVEDRKKSQAAKTFAKKARAKKLEARAEEKNKTLSDITAWRKQGPGFKGPNNQDDQDLEDILNRQQGKRGEQDDNKRRGPQAKSRKRQLADAKFGFGGKKKRKKQNDAASTNDFTFSPWSKGKGRGRGKGKGKGAGAKGKAGGKGGGGRKAKKAKKK